MKKGTGPFFVFIRKGKNVNNFFKKTIVTVLAATLVLAPAVPANAMTKKQVNSEITSLQKKVKKSKSSYNKALKKDQDTLNSYLKVDGVRYYPDPFIVQIKNYKDHYDLYLHFIDISDLTVTDSNDGSTKYVSGYAVVSNKTMDFYGTTVFEATAKEAPHSAEDIQASIDKNQARIKSLKNSKKDSISLNSTYTITTGKSLTLTPVFKYNTSDINKITWKSSNKKVVKISKNGKLLGIAPGTATVSAKLSVTGKTYKTTVNVIAQ